MATVSFVSRFKTGVETVSPFDRFSAPAYVSGAAMAAAGATLMLLRGFTFDLGVATPIIGGCAWLILSAWMLRRFQHQTVAAAIEVVAFAYFQGFAYLFVVYPLAASSAKLADPLLARMDVLIGFDWSSSYSLLDHHRRLLRAASFAYGSFNWQPLLVLPIVASFGTPDRAWRFLLAANWALAITCAFFFFLPATGPVPHQHFLYGHGFASPSTWRADRVLHLIRDRGARYVSKDMLTAMITFPSYHAAAALLFAWVAWPVRFFRWAILFLNIGMAAAAIPIGGHYLVDVLAGLSVGSVSIWASGALTSATFARGLNRPPRATTSKT